jgi:hypothetical protein
MSDSPPLEPVATSEYGRERGWRIAAAVTLIVAILLGGLALAARDSASSHSNQPNLLPTVATSADEGCDNFARFWLNDSQLRLESWVIEGLTNCRQAADGAWIVPSGAGDARLPSHFLMTGDERGATEETRRELLRQIAVFEGTFSPSVNRDLARIYVSQNTAVIGRVDDRQGVQRQRSRYTRLMNAFLLDPTYRDLSDYVGWLIGRKMAAFDQLMSSCLAEPGAAYLRTACRGIEDTLSVGYPPWPWDLKSALLLEEYLGHLARSGAIQTTTQ